MKKIILTHLLSIVSLCVVFGQNLLVLDDDPQAAPEHYSTYAAAEAAAQNGDIIYVKSSGPGYGGITITKSVTLIGQGIFLNSTVKDISGVDSPESRFGNIVVTADNVSLFGLRLGTLNLNGDNSLVRGCNLTGRLTIGVDVSVVLINGNNLQDIIANSAGINNVIITNNIFAGGIQGGSTDQNPFTISHNTFNHLTSNTSLFLLKNSLVYSNLFVKGISDEDLMTNTFLNNISADDTFVGLGNGNQANVDMTTVFTLVPTNSSSLGTAEYDKHFFLKTGSPAINAGHDGTDVGITGGDSPAINAGTAPVPLITDLIVESIDDDGTLNVQIKAEARQ